MSETTNNIHNTSNVPLQKMYKTWFLEYASYVILDRAVPAIEDGLKPVQRRILHALKLMDDGRFHKVANTVGQTMQYHPHGDASIYEALVNLGQKNLLIETQGNWGDFRTGDKAAAARYIEARLSKFALEVAFNPDNTKWQLSYDGRKKEPVTLPVKFPLLLAQGVEGIAVGLSTKILPHNFVELLKASIAILRGEDIEIYPDFAGGGMIDVSNYNEGKRGGRVRVRATINVVDKRKLVIKDIPYGVTTNSLIESIIKASDKNKIKIKRVVDNTAKDVEVLIEIPMGISPDMTIDALYAFTDCEVSIAPNCCIIADNTPVFLSVNELLKRNTHYTVQLLKQELEINLTALLEKLHFASLEQIFIEKRIYRRIEKCETFEAVIETIDKGLQRYKKQFVREITKEDIIKLTEIKIKRISKYDSFKAQDLIKKLTEAIAEIRHHLANLMAYAIDYFTSLLKKYAKGRERKTEIRSFDVIEAKQVVIANQKLYVNRKDGFIGYGLKKDEYISDCSDMDDVIVFKKDGSYQVSKIADKVFVGKNIIYVAIWRKGEERKVYHAIYFDAKSGRTYVKRFVVTSITRDRVYHIMQVVKGSKLLYFAAHANSEREIVTITLYPNTKAKQKVFEYDFSTLAIKGRASKGNILSYYAVRKVTQKLLGNSTLGGRKLWLDISIGRLNTEKRGQYLGEFDTGDTILVLYHDGSYELSNYELSNRYEMKDIAVIQKFDKELIISVIYHHGERKAYYYKRFCVETSSLNQRFYYIDIAEKRCKLCYVSANLNEKVQYTYQVKRGGAKDKAVLDFDAAIEVKGWKILGNKLSGVYKINAIESIVTPQNLTVTDQSVTKTKNVTAKQTKLF